MKKPKDIEELSARLATAATTPLVPPVERTKPEEERPARKGPNRRSKSLFMRLPADLYEKFDAEAVERTKQTGRGVTVQQVILEKLSGVGA